MKNMMKIISGDCLEGMSGYSDGEFDLAIVDPPYGINRVEAFNKKACKCWGQMKTLARNYGGGDFDKEEPSGEYFKELMRVTKNQIIWGGNYFAWQLPKSTRWIVWDKENDNGNICFSNCELAWTSFNGCRTQIFRWKLNGFMAKNRKEFKNRFHPCQKPVDLYRWLLNNFAKKGDKILDTHLGSGGIALACMDLGFDLVRYEIDEYYYKMAKERIEIYGNQENFLKELA